MTQLPEGWTELTVAGNEYHAHLIRGALEEEGIDVVLEAFASGAGAYLHPGGDPTAPVRILVPTPQADEAEVVLSGFDAGDGTVEEPDYQSDDVTDEVTEDVPNDVFAERRPGIPLKILVAAAVAAAIIIGVTISAFGHLDF